SSGPGAATGMGILSPVQPTGPWAHNWCRGSGWIGWMSGRINLRERWCHDPPATRLARTRLFGRRLRWTAVPADGFAAEEPSAAGLLSRQQYTGLKPPTLRRARRDRDLHQP